MSREAFLAIIVVLIAVDIWFRKKLNNLSFRNGRSRQIEEDASIADNFADWDQEYAVKYPDEARKMEERAYRARAIAVAIRRRRNLDR